MYQAIILLASAIIVALTVFLFRKKTDSAFLTFFKVFTLAFCAIGLFRFILSDSFMFVMNDAWYLNVHYKNPDFLHSALRWGYYLNYAVLPMAIFFNSRLFKNLACYVCFPFTLLSIIFFNDYMAYFLVPFLPVEQISGCTILHLVPWARYLIFCLELTMATVIPLLITVKQRHYFNVKDKNEWLHFLVAIPFVFFVMMPVYLP
ncbi:MAG: hypothetical protein IKC56_02265, partial [Clostridia bacterium]|nr:hypothetical protein [Clostridia bacterium]